MYLTPEQITAALDHPRARTTALELDAVLARLDCTCSPAPSSPGRANVYTSDGVLVFSGSVAHTWAWLLNSNPSCTFSELSPMRRDRLVAAFVSPATPESAPHDRLRQIRKFEAKINGAGATPQSDAEHVAGIWDGFARYGGWSYLETLESPASVAAEALGLWQSQDPCDERDDPGAYDGI